VEYHRDAAFEANDWLKGLVGVSESVWKGRLMKRKRVRAITLGISRWVRCYGRRGQDVQQMPILGIPAGPLVLADVNRA
jgi:hypothetical protein